MFVAVPNRQTQKPYNEYSLKYYECHSTHRYVSNKTLHESSGIPFVAEEIKRLTNKYLQNFSGHSNKQVSQLMYYI
jgi:hypothetical protein